MLEVFTQRRMEASQGVREEEMRHMIRSVLNDAQQGQPVDYPESHVLEFTSFSDDNHSRYPVASKLGALVQKELKQISSLLFPARNLLTNLNMHPLQSDLETSTCGNQSVPC